MSEIFISYSRRDKVFVERFLKALNENGYSSANIWVDWEDIPASSKWEKEIRKGIEETNSVIFILSPEWIKSNECAKELAIAAEYNKRLFPIIWQNVDPSTIQKELGSLNWIFFRETDNFDEAMQKLLAALKTDLEWVSQHTNLLRRANEWETKKRDQAYLLRGAELQAAETWLAQSSENKQPRPSPLQSEYIFASRRDDVRRQRRNLIWVSTALVVSVALAIAAVVSGIEAVRSSQRALASELAAQANTLVNSQPDLALLLSLESNYIGDELGETDAAWLGSLITTLNSSPKLDTFLREHDSDVRAVAFSSDGNWLATTGNPSGEVGQVILWDMNTSDIHTTFQTFTGGSQRFLGVAFNADGSRMAAAGNDRKVFVWNTQKCCTSIADWEVNGTVRALVIMKIKEVEYVVVAVGKEVTFWNLADKKMNPALTLEIPTTDDSVRILSLAISPKNNLLAAGSEDGTVTVWNVNTGEMNYNMCSYGDTATNDETVCVLSGAGETDVRGVAFNQQGTLLASTSSDRRVWLWDAENGELLARSPLGNEVGHINTVTGVAFNPQNDHELATASWDNTVHLWELVETEATWSIKPVETLAGHANSVWSLAYTPDGHGLASVSSDKTVILWRLDQRNQIGTPIIQMEGDVWALANAWDGEQFAAGDVAGNIHLWPFDGVALGELKTLQHPDGVLALAYSHDNQWLASAGYDGNIIVWSPETAKEAWRIEGAHTSDIWALAFSPDDHLLASISFDKTAKLWDTSTHKQVGEPLIHENEMYALAFNQDGTQLLTAGYDARIFIWDITDPASLPLPGLLEGHSSFVNSLAFNPTFPPLLASTSDDKTLLIWNSQVKEHTPQVLGLNESMEAVTFRPAGDWLASATNNNTILLWQLDSQRCSEDWDKDACKPTQLGTPLNGHRGPVENVAFLSDTKLVSSSADGWLILWDLDKHNWYETACRIVKRGFTPAENSQFIAGKINITLLNSISWLSEAFGNSPHQEAPSCLQE